MPLHRVLIALAAIVCPSLCQAQSPLETVFLQSGSDWRFGWFNLQVNTPVKVTSLDVHITSGDGAPFSLNVYMTPVGGAYGHNVRNSGEWMLVSTGSGTTAPTYQPSTCDISDVVLVPGTYGVAMECTPASRYYGQSPGTTYSNTDLTLTIGRASNTTFGSTISSSSQTWQGVIHYTAADVNATGACCLSSGACQFGTVADCATAAATFRGEGVACAAVTCLQPTSCCEKASGACAVVMGTCNSTQVRGNGGACAPAACPLEACCSADGASCTNVTRAACLTGTGIPRGTGTTCGTLVCGAGFVEVEPNETKALADTDNSFTLAGSGGYVRGNSRGVGSTTPGAATSRDYFRLRFPAAPLGIYRNRLNMDTYALAPYNAAVPFQSGIIWGLDQVASFEGAWPACGVVGTSGTTDYTYAQESLFSTRSVQWYGFGKEEEFYFRVTGNPDTPADYVAVWAKEPIAPVSIGNFAPGMITITTADQGHTTNTDLWVYDAMLDPIDGYGNDGASLNGGYTSDTTAPSFLRRTYAPGTYYLALSSANLASTKGSPCDDQVRDGVMLDFPNALVAGRLTANSDVAFAITDANGTTPFPATATVQDQVLWFRFTVGGASGVCCRGSTCNSTYADATACANALPGGTLAGSVFVASSPCNATGNTTTPCCHADYNKTGGIAVQDIFDYLNDWFIGAPTARVGGDGDTGSPAVADIFDFINAWLAGGC